jgi:hypothetical protein
VRPPRPVCRCDTIGQVRIPLLFLLLATSLLAQDDDFRVYTDAPRLLLTAQRLRLLQRERDRQSMRWQQFDALVAGGAAMPESGLAWALYYRVAKDAAAGKKAVDWVLSDAAQNTAQDLRQLALVFDWCGPVMSPAQADRLGAKIERMLAAAAPTPANVAQQSARALAAIAIADRLPDHGESFLKPILDQWWRGNIVKRLQSGDPAIPREQAYALFEFLHAVRDNLKIDPREAAPEYFKELPLDHLMGHYPSSYQGPENDYRVPVYVRDGEPNLTEAVLSRAAELAMVAYDSNAAENQWVQGWLMQDRFMMRGALGIPYEFLWANPYQPGLSYFLAPLVFYDATTGHLFARSSWDEDAIWVGYFDGRLQLFRDGKIQTLKAGAAADPLRVSGIVILSARDRDAYRFRADEEQTFVIGLAPHARYEVEIDDQELWEEETDAGGTLMLALPEGTDAGVRIRRRAD